MYLIIAKNAISYEEILICDANLRLFIEFVEFQLLFYGLIVLNCRSVELLSETLKTFFHRSRRYSAPLIPLSRREKIIVV